MDHIGRSEDGILVCLALAPAAPLGDVVCDRVHDKTVSEHSEKTGLAKVRARCVHVLTMCNELRKYFWQEAAFSWHAFLKKTTSKHLLCSVALLRGPRILSQPASLGCLLKNARLLTEGGVNNAVDRLLCEERLWGARGREQKRVGFRMARAGSPAHVAPCTPLALVKTSVIFSLSTQSMQPIRTLRLAGCGPRERKSNDSNELHTKQHRCGKGSCRERCALLRPASKNRRFLGNYHQLLTNLMAREKNVVKAE